MSAARQSEKPSPWWYRRRSAVFAFIYLTGFIGGAVAAPRHLYVPAFASLGAWLGPAGAQGLLALAFLLTLLCLWIRAWGSSYLGAAVVWNANARTDSLIVAGPFRYTRNPLYFGNAFLAMGFGLLAPVAGTAFILVANAIFIAALIGCEEHLMRERYGAAFRAYCSQVPRFFPRLLPAPSHMALRPSILQGVRSEIFTAALAVGLFAWILMPAYGVYVFVACYAAGVFAERALQAGTQVSNK
jgi:protein-S-isoprenylcysteine O-methyltransferase Ste14